MKREIIKIDKEKCNGCGECVPNCHEGALQIIDGKATLVSEIMCDGLGACIGHCPQDAITIEEREAEAFDELKIITTESQRHKDNISQTAKKIMIEAEVMENGNKQHLQGCPGSISRQLRRKDINNIEEKSKSSELITHNSELTNWPIQLHLINPDASYFGNADILLSADCVAYASGNLHQQYLKGKTLLIACPKLDSNKEVYVEKLISLIDNSGIKSVTVLKMEVPCCGGLLQIAQTAIQQAKRNIPVHAVTIGIDGEEK
jgi:NAD-dependent dihydropyrimidine dehydrogenase PreA subunit